MKNHAKLLFIGRVLGVAICCFAVACGDDDTAGPSPERDAGTIVDPNGWQPPIAIPMPEFGIRETVESVYGDPEFFTHYVDNTHAVATDDSNEFGSLDQPRLTIPGDVEAGSVVLVAGGPYVNDSILRLRNSGTVDAPIFLRGRPDAIPKVNRAVAIHAAYIIVEHLDFDYENGTKNLSIRPETDPAAEEVHHVAVRGCELHNYNRDLGATGNSSMIGISNGHNDNDVYVHNVVIWANYIHDNGDATLAERDIHGVSVSANAREVWIVDNHSHHNSGDSVQINYYRTPPYNIPHHIYIGRNDFHDDQENAIDLKGCRDIIISQNRIHDYEGLSRGAAVGYGTGMVIHHADDHAERVLVLYNEIWGCTSTGITVSHETDEIYLVGNVIHGNYFPGTDEHGPTSPWYPGVGIRIRNDGTTYVLGNLITDTHHGIVSTATPPSGLVVQGNVVANLHSGADGSHLCIESGDMADAATLDHNLYFQDGMDFTVRLGQSNDLHALADLPAHAANCVASDPLFAAPDQGDFRPGTTSPTIDSGIPLDAALQSVFGFTMDLDYDASPRPQGAGWDLGPFER